MNFDEIIDRRSSESLKWHIYEEDVLPLWVADMDFRCADEVVNALHERVDHGIFGYGLPPKDLAKIIVDRLQRLYKWNISEQHVSYVPGCVTGFNLALRAFCQPGDAVIIQTPVYPPFLSAPADAGLRRLDNQLIKHPDGYYEIDFDLFEKQIIENKVKLFILCNPHNPVGRVFKRAELQRLAEICLKHDVIICSDDIHCDLIYSGYHHIPVASLSPEIAARTITLMAPSKTYNIAGLHASVVIIENPQLYKQYCAARHGLVSNPGVLGLTAARAAYLHADPWLQEVMDYLEHTRDWLFEVVKTQFPGIRMAKPEGTFLAWLDCTDLHLQPSPQQFFLEKARVGLNDGKDFGTQEKEFVRFNFASPHTVLVDAVDRMRSALIKEGYL